MRLGPPCTRAGGTDDGSYKLPQIMSRFVEISFFDWSHPRSLLKGFCFLAVLLLFLDNTAIICTIYLHFQNIDRAIWD